MEQQRSLFDDETVSPPPTPPRLSAQLKIAPQSAAPLSKAQRTFNRLLARIEQLRYDLELKTGQLNEALAFHVAALHPLHQSVMARRKELVRLLAPFFTKAKPALGKRQKDTLRDLLVEQLNGIAAEEQGLVDDDLRQLFSNVAGQSIEELEAESLAEAREHMTEMFEEMGIDADLSSLRPDMDEAEIAQLMAKLAAQVEQSAAAHTQNASTGATVPHRKTKRQLAQEERARQMEEARTRNLSSIYKQLARALHPDLEPDPVRKQEKECLMKELTVAYKQNDLHTLLRLELEWIQRREGDVARLGDEKLAIYNAVLKEQVEALQEEWQTLPQQPRYQALQRYTGPFGYVAYFDLKAEQEKAKQMLESIEVSLARLRSTEAMSELREVLKIYRDAVRQRRPWSLADFE